MLAFGRTLIYVVEIEIEIGRSTHRLLDVWIIVAHFQLCCLLGRYTVLEV